MESPGHGLDFEAFLSALASAPSPAPLQPFAARDHARLGYRHYPSESRMDLVLLHGSAADSAYLRGLAASLSAARAANVYTPDLRGHGPSPQRRGDIDYIEQLEDDLADLIGHIKSTTGGKRKIIVAGHSSGGGLAIRFAGGRYGGLAGGYLLLAPYLGHNAPTVRPGSAGWAIPRRARIIALAVLNRFGMTRLNGTRILSFNLPVRYRTGNDTLSYSYRLMTGLDPTDYKADLRRIRVPLLVLVGSGDEAFVAGEFTPAIKPLVPRASIKIIDGASHLGVMTDARTSAEVIGWLATL